LRAVKIRFAPHQAIQEVKEGETMVKRKRLKERACKVCGKVYPIEQLSNKLQCYDCSKARMIEMFDRLWKWGRE